MVRFYTTDSSFSRIKRVASSLVVATLCILHCNHQAAFAQVNKNLTKNVSDLSQKETDLIKKEAAILKQLSNSSAPALAAPQQESMARMEKFPVLPSSNNKAADKSAVSGAKQPRDNDRSSLIAEKDRRIETLSQQLSQLRNRLLLAETEVERLSSIVDERNRRQMSAITQRRLAEVNDAPPPAINNRIVPPSNSGPAPAAQDMQVITVKVDKAHLRTGPGEDNSPLMTVSRGTRLAVETRQGSWYRVISPAGTRAWISSGVVIFGDLNASGATRISGLSSESSSDKPIFPRGR